MGLRGVGNERAAVVSLKKGGTMIEYEDEDPAIRRDFERALEEAGIPCRMPRISA